MEQERAGSGDSLPNVRYCLLFFHMVLWFVKVRDLCMGIYERSSRVRGPQ